MTTDEERRAVRNALIAKLYNAGCTMQDISKYLGVSHGLVSLTVRNDENCAARPRGRPHSEAPPPPTPRQIMGDEYVPEYMNESEKTVFLLKLPGQPLHHKRTRPIKRGPSPAAVDYDPIVPVESEVGLSLDDDSSRPETETEEEKVDGSAIRDRIAEVASRVNVGS